MLTAISVRDNSWTLGVSGKIRLYSGTVAIEARDFLKAGIVANTCNPSSWEAKAGRSRVQGHYLGRWLSRKEHLLYKHEDVS